MLSPPAAKAGELRGWCAVQAALNAAYKLKNPELSVLASQVEASILRHNPGLAAKRHAQQAPAVQQQVSCGDDNPCGDAG